MKRVLIFTDEDSWDDIDLAEYSNVKEQWDPLYPNDDRKAVKFDLSGDGPARLEVADDCLQDGVYLLYDDMDAATFHTLTDPCLGEETVVLVHTHGMWNKQTISPHLQLFCLEGSHTNYPDTKLYRPVFLILADNVGNKKDRVLAFLQKGWLQGTAHIFMSGCMTPYNANSDFLKAKDCLIAYPATSELVRAFYEDVYPNVTKRGEPPRDYSNELKVFCKALVSVLWP